jgi:small-conductance mechanosensitive channel
MSAWEQIRTVLDSTFVTMGSVKVTPMVLITTVLILAVTAIFSKILIRFLKRNVYTQAHISEGVQESISRVLHYTIMTCGGFVALNNIGLDLTGIAAIGAVLGVGIGFGLQNLANNFISGLVMLFERPIQVGDFVDVAGVLGKVRSINARSTTVDTQDNVSIIVPNSHFISQNVTNWSYRDVRTRIHVPIHVALDSDAELVRSVLLDVGRAHSSVLSDPEPRVQFLAFGESALQFVLLVWINDPPQQFFIRSDLNFAIATKFREKGIQIPFPQRDLHVRSAVPIDIDTKERGGI